MIFNFEGIVVSKIEKKIKISNPRNFEEETV